MSALGASTAEPPVASVLLPVGKRYPKVERQIRNITRDSAQWVRNQSLTKLVEQQQWSTIQRGKLTSTLLSAARDAGARRLVFFRAQPRQRRGGWYLAVKLAFFDARGKRLERATLRAPIRGRGRKRKPIVPKRVLQRVFARAKPSAGSPLAAENQRADRPARSEPAEAVPAILLPVGQRFGKVQRQLQTLTSDAANWVSSLEAFRQLRRLSWPDVERGNLGEPLLNAVKHTQARLLVFVSGQLQRRGRQRALVLELAFYDASGTRLGTETLHIPLRGRGPKRRPIVPKHAARKALRHARERLMQVSSQADATHRSVRATQKPTVKSAGKNGAPAKMTWPAWSHAERIAHVRTFSQIRGRVFDYYDVLSRNLRELRTGASAAFGGHLEVYPLEIERASGSRQRFGLEAEMAHDLGQTLRLADAPDTNAQLTWQQWRVGPAVRFDYARILIKVTGSYGRYSSVVARPGDAGAPALPSVVYPHFRLALGARHEMQWLAFEGELAYRFIGAARGVGTELFPDAAVGGIHAHVGASRRLFWGLEAYAAVNYDHFYYDLRPEPGDRYLAGGALDLHFSGEVGLGWVY